MANHYTDQQVAEALAALELNGGAIRPTARELGIPPATLVNWRDGVRAAVPVNPNAEKQPHDFAQVWADTETEILALLREKAPVASFRDLSIFAGIAADKHLDYSQGRKGSQQTVNIDNRTQLQADGVILQIIQARQAVQGATQE